MEKAAMAVTEFQIKPRHLLPAMVIATPLDLKGTHWTRQGPSIEGLKRLQKLAAFSHELLQAMLVAGADLSDLKVSAFTYLSICYVIAYKLAKIVSISYNYFLIPSII